MNPHGKLPGSWNVGGLHLVPVDPRDSSMDTPDRIAEREHKGVKRANEDFMVLPTIYVTVRTNDREATIKDLLRHLALPVNGDHVPGFISAHIGPNIEVV